MFYSGTVWGFSFLEYIFKEEKIFEKEKCENVDPAGNFKIFLLDCIFSFLECLNFERVTKNKVVKHTILLYFITLSS